VRTLRAKPNRRPWRFALVEIGPQTVLAGSDVGGGGLPPSCGHSLCSFSAGAIFSHLAIGDRFLLAGFTL
jgi:hypothetical protein